LRGVCGEEFFTHDDNISGGLYAQNDAAGQDSADDDGNVLANNNFLTDQTT
jgi:hypothetical protein